jgi:hypothetical protein
VTEHPCPVCGRPRKVYTRVSVRGPGTKSGGHRVGERRRRRDLRATCGRKKCLQILRARTLLKGAGDA